MAVDRVERVFVLGCSRGGTTVAQRVLSERLNLFTLPETRFFSNLIGNAETRLFPTTARPQRARRVFTSRLREKLGLGTGLEHIHVAGLDLPPGRKFAPVQDSTARFVDRLDQVARTGGHAGWLEKSPSHAHYAAEIHQLVPDAWMIHIIRDPRDTIASIWDAAQKYDDPWGIIYDRIERAADKWNAATRCAAGMAGRPGQFFVAYEDLVRNPDAIVTEIAQALNLPLGHAAAARPQRIADAQEQWKAGAISGPVRAARSKWQTALTAQERQTVENALCPKALGFAQDIARGYPAPPVRKVA